MSRSLRCRRTRWTPRSPRPRPGSCAASRSMRTRRSRWARSSPSSRTASPAMRRPRRTTPPAPKPPSPRQPERPARARGRASRRRPGGQLGRLELAAQLCARPRTSGRALAGALGRRAVSSAAGRSPPAPRTPRRPRYGQPPAGGPLRLTASRLRPARAAGSLRPARGRAPAAQVPAQGQPSPAESAPAAPRRLRPTPRPRSTRRPRRCRAPATRPTSPRWSASSPPSTP